MRTPKTLDPQQRIVFHPEWTECPRCGGALRGANSLSWDKTVQTLEGILSIASRPGHCSQGACPAYRTPIGSAEGLQVAPVGFTYGYDVIVRIGWLRQEGLATFGEVQKKLEAAVQISESHVRYLYHQVYLPLLACRERQFREQLATAAQAHNGLLIALDGLAPEGGEPQLWFVREITTGLTLRSGWMSAQDQRAFEAFLQPLAEMEWPIRGVLSDKQTGLVPAVAAVFPESRHAFCQAHYFKNLSLPLADADRTLNVEIRKAIRAELGAEVRAEKVPGSAQGLLTVTGLLPNAGEAGIEARDPNPKPVGTEDLETPRPEKLGSLASKASEDQALADGVVTQLRRRIRYLLTLETRAPFVLAGLEAYTQLMEIVEFCEEIGAHRADPRLVRLAQGLRQALAPFSDSVLELQQAEHWLRKIAGILDPPPLSTGAAVSEHLHGFLDALGRGPETLPFLGTFRSHLAKVTQSYALGLFHCYDLKEVPRTNNGLESHFRETRRRLLRTTGQRGQTRRALLRTGAWELLSRPKDETEGRVAFRQVDPQQWREERHRLRQHLERFRLHTRSPRLAALQLDRLRGLWVSLPPLGAG